MFLTRPLTFVYDSALAVVFPQACLVCGESVESRADGFACRECWSATRVLSEIDTVCWKCGKPSQRGIHIDRREQTRCHRCDDDDYTAARACGIYGQALRAAVLSLKRQPYISRRVAELLAATAKQLPFNHCTRIIPVPLHPDRERIRGFNQAETIGRELSRRIGLPLDQKTLFRTTHTERHRAGMDGRARRETVERVFAVRHPHLIVDESILLVDDVFTTGATASACARVLFNGGVKEVFVLTIARSVDSLHFRSA